MEPGMHHHAAQELANSVLADAIQVSDVVMVGMAVDTLAGPQQGDDSVRLDSIEQTRAIMLLFSGDGPVVTPRSLAIPPLLILEPNRGWADSWLGAMDHATKALSLVDAGQASTPGMTAQEVADAMPVVICPGPCGRRLFGPVADRGACTSCFPEVGDGDVAVGG